MFKHDVFYQIQVNSEIMLKLAVVRRKKFCCICQLFWNINYNQYYVLTIVYIATMTMSMW